MVPGQTGGQYESGIADFRWGWRHVQLRGGAGLKVTCEPGRGLRMEERDHLGQGGPAALVPRGTRFFWLTAEGDQPYSNQIQARNRSGVIVARLDVAIKPLKKVGVTFLRCKDRAGHLTRTVPSAGHIVVAKMNEIFRVQANLDLQLNWAGWIEAGHNLGSVVRHSINPANDERRFLLRSGMDSDINFYIVWEYETDSLPSVGLDGVDAHTIGNSCFIEDDKVRPYEAYAHEAGHMLGLSDQYDHSRSYN